MNRWPYVCTGCNKKYNNQCCFTKYKYDAKKAQDKADLKLVTSRRGIDIDDENFKQIDNIVKEGIDNKKSIYQITIENKEEIDKSVTTLYRYINKGYLTTKRIDLPYAVTYKKRKYKKSMPILKIRKLTEQVILILIICHIFTNTPEYMSGNLIFLEPLKQITIIFYHLFYLICNLFY